MTPTVSFPAETVVIDDDSPELLDSPHAASEDTDKAAKQANANIFFIDNRAMFLSLSLLRVTRPRILPALRLEML
ncbi:hypothetical protein BPY_19680 [Bifidobacterium psychraerophilum]